MKRGWKDALQTFGVDQSSFLCNLFQINDFAPTVFQSQLLGIFFLICCPAVPTFAADVISLLMVHPVTCLPKKSGTLSGSALKFEQCGSGRLFLVLNILPLLLIMGRVWNWTFLALRSPGKTGEQRGSILTSLHQQEGLSIVWSNQRVKTASLT